jgi:hypothetical protein
MIKTELLYKNNGKIMYANTGMRMVVVIVSFVNHATSANVLYQSTDLAV